MTGGGAFSTGGRGAQGDFTGVGGAGGLATSVGFSADPALRMSPLPDASPPVLIEGEAVVRGGGTGDFGFSITFSFGGAGVGSGGGGAGTSSGCGRVVLVPSVQVMVSGAQSSSSSSISAQFPCADCPLSGARRLAIWMPYFLSSSSVSFLGSGVGTAEVRYIST